MKLDMEERKNNERTKQPYKEGREQLNLTEKGNNIQLKKRGKTKEGRKEEKRQKKIERKEGRKGGREEVATEEGRKEGRND